MIIGGPATVPEIEGTPQSLSSPINSGASTIELAPAPGYPEGTRFNAAGVLTSASPVVTYRVESSGLAAGQSNVMKVTIQADQTGGIVPSVSVLDEDGHALAGQLLANGPGLYTLQIKGIAPGKEYFVRVGSSTSPLANSSAVYRLDVNFSQTAAPLTSYVSGTLGPAQTQQFFQLNVAQSALFQLALDTSSSNLGSKVAVQLAIFDQSGNQVYQTVGTTGGTLSANAVLLQQGNYLVRVCAASSAGSLVGNLGFSVLGNVLSDPIGPVLVDPTGAPPNGNIPVPPPFYWNNIVITAPRPVPPPPFYWVNVYPPKPPVVIVPKPSPTPAIP
jgi:hypothetical protein